MEERKDLSEILETYLYADSEAPLHPATVSLQLTRPQMRFLLLAIACFKQHLCPLEGKGDFCPLLGTQESVHTGALEVKCLLPCDRWAELLARDVVPAAFRPRPGAGTRVRARPTQVSRSGIPQTKEPP